MVEGKVDLEKRANLRKALIGAAAVGVGVVGLSGMANAGVIFRSGSTEKSLTEMASSTATGGVKHFTATIETDSDWTDDVVPIWQTPKANTISIVQVNLTTIGASLTNSNLEVRSSSGLGSSGSTLFSSGQTAATAGLEVTSLQNNTSIAAKSFIVFKPSSTPVGAPTSITITVYYTID